MFETIPRSYHNLDSYTSLMIGVILCGGQSTRMGTDKGLLKSNAVTWVQSTVDKLNVLSIPIRISINAKQFADYTKLFENDDLIIDNSSLKMKGPLYGVLSAHLKYPTKDLMILACDMPLMETAVLEELIKKYNEHRQFEAFVFTKDGEPEPLCGVYTSKGLAHIYDLYKTDQLQKHSMKFMLEHISTFFIPLSDDKKKYFSNFNTHAELNGL